MAQSVWWLASIIGLQQGLIIYIDQIKGRANIGKKEGNSTSKDSQAE
jgi:hypothetical protein